MAKIQDPAKIYQLRSNEMDQRLSLIQHQIDLQGARKGAPSPGQKRKRPKSKSNLSILKQINDTQEIKSQL